MTNELDYVKSGFPVTLQFIKANLATNATTDMTLDQGGTGWVVPAGYNAHAVALCATANADLTTGQTTTAKVIDDGTELVAGPEAALANTTQRATGVARVGAQPIAAGSVVGVSLAANTTGAATIDYDAILSLVLTPA